MFLRLMIMSTIKAKIDNILRSLHFQKHQFGITGDYKFVQTTNFPIPLSEHMDWSIRHGGFNDSKYNGKGQRVGVLDSGFDIDHRDLKGKITTGCFIPGCKDQPCYLDRVSHGTFCAGEIVAKSDGQGIVGVAPEATCFGGKVIYGDYGDTLSNFENALIKGIRSAVSEGCGVISMSLGSSHNNPKVEEALSFAVENGVIPMAASGNEGLQGSPYKSYPASYHDCISVAAADKNDLSAWFSTEGKGDNPLEQPEFAIASLEYYWGCVPGGYSKMIGTSMSCPMAAGVALLWRQAMEENGLLKSGREVITQFREWIKKVVNDTNHNGWDKSIGYGVLLLDNNDDFA